jgi:hypothetical protein
MLEDLNTNKYILGVCMIMFNLGSKYLVLDISKSQEMFFKSVVIRRVTLFSIFFVATRDLVKSLILTAVFVVIALGILHEDSKYNILPPSFYDSVYTKDEYEMAKLIVQSVEKKNSDNKSVS